MTTITGNEKKVFNALRKANGTKTMQQIATDLNVKVETLRSVVGVLKRKFTEAGIEFKYSPKVLRGNGNSEDLEGFLAGLDGEEDNG